MDSLDLHSPDPGPGGFRIQRLVRFGRRPGISWCFPRRWRRWWCELPRENTKNAERKATPFHEPGSHSHSYSHSPHPAKDWSGSKSGSENQVQGPNASAKRNGAPHEPERGCAESQPQRFPTRCGWSATQPRSGSGVQSANRNSENSHPGPLPDRRGEGVVLCAPCVLLWPMIFV